MRQLTNVQVICVPKPDIIISAVFGRSAIYCIQRPIEAEQGFDDDSGNGSRERDGAKTLSEAVYPIARGCRRSRAGGFLARLRRGIRAHDRGSKSLFIQSCQELGPE